MKTRRLAASALVLLAACSTGREDTTSTPAGPSRSERALVGEFGPAVERLGLRITRAGLVKRFGVGGYDENGRHLAFYVEPVGPAEAGAYVTNLDRLAKVFLPEAFDRLPQIDSFDVCQEPPGVDDREQPQVVTQFLINRAQAASIDWETVDLETMLVAAIRAPRR
ncbi:MAG TPA: hypothetical protein VK988_18220 [Acidimicrobiales bacterium]|nr:hypothetical protein [Acidimicrobiales bacterium]